MSSHEEINNLASPSNKIQTPSPPSNFPASSPDYNIQYPYCEPQLWVSMKEALYSAKAELQLSIEERKCSLKRTIKGKD